VAAQYRVASEMLFCFMFPYTVVFFYSEPSRNFFNVLNMQRAESESLFLVADLVLLGGHRSRRKFTVQFTYMVLLNYQIQNKQWRTVSFLQDGLFLNCICFLIILIELLLLTELEIKIVILNLFYLMLRDHPFCLLTENMSFV
jgi:hypothetical protein